MQSEKIKEILKSQTMNLFSEKWYFDTSEEIMKTKSDSGYVYFIRSLKSGLIKIGSAVDISRRTSELKKAMNENLTLVGFIYAKDFDLVKKKIEYENIEQKKYIDWYLITNCEKMIEDNGGVVVNEPVFKKMKISEGEYLSKARMVRQDSVYYAVKEKLKEIPSREKIFLKSFHKSLNLPEEIHQRKTTATLMSIIENKEMKHSKGKTNGQRFVILL